MKRASPARGRRASGSIRVGLDVLPVARMARLTRDNPGIQDTIFTRLELLYCLGKRRSLEHLAARFAAKEAVLKALGSGLGQRMRWTDVEIVSGVLGRPMVRLHGEVEAFARRRGLMDLDVSLSHTSEVAIAHALAVCRAPSRVARPRKARA
jgi:holo-[acyl-carrier protein] synthase